MLIDVRSQVVCSVSEVFLPLARILVGSFSQVHPMLLFMLSPAWSHCFMCSSLNSLESLVVLTDGRRC